MSEFEGVRRTEQGVERYVSEKHKPIRNNRASLRVMPELVASLLKVPADWVLLGATYSFDENCFKLKFAHPDFPLVEQLQRDSEIEAIYHEGAEPEFRVQRPVPDDNPLKTGIAPQEKW